MANIPEMDGQKLARSTQQTEAGEILPQPVYIAGQSNAMAAATNPDAPEYITHTQRVTGVFSIPDNKGYSVHNTGFYIASANGTMLEPNEGFSVEPMNGVTYQGFDVDAQTSVLFVMWFTEA